MDKYEFSIHAEEQILVRGLDKMEVIQVLTNPQQIIYSSLESGIAIFQSIFEKDRTYLLRVFVNIETQPKRIITVYQTSKISKYWNYEADL